MMVSQLRSGLQESRERLFASIRGLSEEQFRYVPAGETYAVATHLAHVLRIERVGRMTIAEIAVKMAAHEDEHAAEIAKLVRHAPSSGRVIIPLTRRS